MTSEVFSTGIDTEIFAELERRGLALRPVAGAFDEFARKHPNAVVLASEAGTTIDEALAANDSLKAILLAPSTASPGASVSDILRKHWFGYFQPPFDMDEIVDTVREAQSVRSWSDGIEVISSRPNWLTLQVRCRRYTAERLTRFMTEMVADLPSAERENIGLAFREIVLNGMEHGAAFDGSKHLCVSCLRTTRFVMYFVRDPGTGFDITSLPHAAISNPAENPAQHLLYRAQQGIRAGGFGLLVARDLMDEMLHNESGNEVVLIKYLDHSSEETEIGKGADDAE